MKASRFAVLVATLLLLRPPESDAQASLFWDTSGAGGVQGGSGNWLGAPNWNTIFSNTSWIDGTRAVFSATPGTVTVNGAVNASGLTFSVGGYQIFASGSSTLTLVGAAPTLHVSNAGQAAIIFAPIGGSVGLTKSGAGTLMLAGSTANSYTGLATVTDGTLNLSKIDGNTLTGNLTIGDGSGAAASAIVVQNHDFQIANTPTIRIEQDGFWNLASGNHSQPIGALTMSAGSIATGTGVLTIIGNVTTEANAAPASISGVLHFNFATRTFDIADGNAATDLDFSAAIFNGIGGLIKTGNGTLKLSGTAANSYSGVTTVNTGDLVLDKPAGVNAIPGDLIIGDGGAVTVVLRQDADQQIADTATVSVRSNGYWDLVSGNRSETVAGLVIDGLVFTGTGALTVNGNVSTSLDSRPGAGIIGKLDLGGATRTFDVADGIAAVDLHIPAVISNGIAGVVKAGTGTLRLSGVNTFSGPVAINGGVVSILTVGDAGVNGHIGAGNSISFDGGTLALTATSNAATDRAVTLNAGGGTLDITQGTATVTMSGVFTGAGGLTKTGPGTLTLDGALANDHAGTTTAAEGTLNLSKPADVSAIGGNLAVGDGSGAAASAIVVQGADEQIPDTATVATAADGFWNLASGDRSETIAALTMNSGSIATGGGTLTVNGNVTTGANAVSASLSGQINLGGATRTFDIADGTAAFGLDISAAVFNGAGGLTKTGDGTLRVRGASAFSGPVAINAGTLIARNGSAIGDSSDVTVASVVGATLSIDGDETIGSLAGDGSVVLGTASVLNVGGGSSTTFSGSISGAGGLTHSGDGTLTVSGTPTYTGNTLVTSGTLALNSGIASAAGSLTVNAPGALQARSTVNRAIAGDGTITATGTLIIGDASSATGFAFNGTLNSGSNTVTLADADVAQLGVVTTLGANGRLDSFNGAILAGGRSVTSAAAASAIISASFTNNGTVNGPTTSGQSLTFLGPVNGAGNYTGNVVFTGGYSPGNGPATVTLENATFGVTNTLTMELGGPAPGTQHDHLVFNGQGTPQVTWNGTLNLVLINGFTPQAGQFFDILDFDVARDAGTFSSINVVTNGLMPAGLTFDFSELYTSGLISVVSTGGTTFAQWAAAELGDPGALPGGNHDGDGYDNLTEYALALFPPFAGASESAGSFHVYPEGERMRVLFWRHIDRTDITIRVQVSTDLTNWSDLAVSVNSAPFTGAGFVSENRAHPPGEPGLVEVRDSLNVAGNARRQMRLHITLTP